MGQIIDGVHVVHIQEFNSYLHSLPKNDFYNPYKFNITGGSWENENHRLFMIEPLKNSGYFLDCSETVFSGELSNLINLFKNCTYLVKSPKLPINAINIIGLFFNCSNLVESPEIPNSATNLNSTFKNCTRLKKVVNIPEEASKMDECFYNCTNLTSVAKFPSKVKSLFRTFRNCYSLVDVDFLSDTITELNYTFEYCTKLKTCKLPKNIVKIIECFSNCTSLETTPYIPNSVENMRDCFKGCSNLKHVTNIPTNVENLKNCFENCTSLNEPFIIPSNVTILTECFKGCTSLKVAPKFLSSNIFSYMRCFENCINLEYVPIMTNYHINLKVPESLRDMFKNCPKLKGFYQYIPYKEKDEIAFYEIKTKSVSNVIDGFGERLTVYKNGDKLYEEVFNTAMQKDFSAKIYTLMVSITEDKFEHFFTKVRKYLLNFINGFIKVPIVEDAVIVGTKDKTNTFIKGVNLE